MYAQLTWALNLQTIVAQQEKTINPSADVGKDSGWVGGEWEIAKMDENGGYKKSPKVADKEPEKSRNSNNTRKPSEPLNFRLDEERITQKSFRNSEKSQNPLDFWDVPPREMCTSKVDFRSKVLKTAGMWGIRVGRGVTIICTHTGAIFSKGALHHFGVGSI